MAGKVTASWNPTVHRCLFHTATCLQDDIKLIRGQLPLTCSPSLLFIVPFPFPLSLVVLPYKELSPVLCCPIGVLSNSCSSSTPPTTVEVPEVLPLGQKGEEFLAKVPISLSFSLEKMEGVANLDRGAKYVCAYMWETSPLTFIQYRQSL